MSTPPSFTPDPKRRRPGSDDVHVVGEEIRSGAPTPPPEAIAPQMWRISEDEADAAALAEKRGGKVEPVQLVGARKHYAVRGLTDEDFAGSVVR